MKKLSTESKKFFNTIKKAYKIEDHVSLAILEQASEALMRIRDAQKVIDEEGLVLTDRFGQKKNHPATVIERDSRNAFLKALNQLGVDVNSIPEEEDFFDI